jgi:pimeloyl-ACP methyl ester carboxylesterase
MRGYGQSDCPPNIQDYTRFQFVGDVVALVHALGYEQAVIAGHDLGAQVAHNAAILRPDMFRAMILLSVPYGVRAEAAVKPIEGMGRRAPADQQFYQTYLQTPGMAGKEFDAETKRTLRMFLYSFSGSASFPSDRYSAARLFKIVAVSLSSSPPSFSFMLRDRR